MHENVHVAEADGFTFEGKELNRASEPSPLAAPEMTRFLEERHGWTRGRLIESWQKRIAHCGVLIGSGDLLNVDELSVAWTAVAQAGGVGFRFAPVEGHGASLVRRPGAVKVTDDGLGLAVAESDLVDSHGGTSFSRAPPSLAALLVRQGKGVSELCSGRKRRELSRRSSMRAARPRCGRFAVA